MILRSTPTTTPRGTFSGHSVSLADSNDGSAALAVTYTSNSSVGRVSAPQASYRRFMPLLTRRAPRTTSKANGLITAQKNYGIRQIHAKKCHIAEKRRRALGDSGPKAVSARHAHHRPPTRPRVISSRRRSPKMAWRCRMRRRQHTVDRGQPWSSYAGGLNRLPIRPIL
jgi:hypothetical protein